MGALYPVRGTMTFLSDFILDSPSFEPPSVRVYRIFSVKGLLTISEPSTWILLVLTLGGFLLLGRCKCGIE